MAAYANTGGFSHSG